MIIVKGGVILGKAKDLTGQRFGRLLVLERVEDHIYPSGSRRARWKCKCDCGKITFQLSNVLLSGTVVSCGCWNEEKKHKPSSRRKDLTGKRFGKLTVIERADNIIEKGGWQKSAWVCLCDCGNMTTVRQRRLQNGSTRSCGCLAREWQTDKFSPNLTGQKFGMLTAIKRTENHRMTNGRPVSPKWLCRCDCGNTKEVASADLLSGRTTSCGCLVSRGEKEVSEYLRENNINFKQQYSFNDLRGPRNGLLRFDFGLLDENDGLICLIEYQGIQHYKDDSEFGKDTREITDPLKRKYCEKNNINLYEIRYDDSVKEKIEGILQIENLQQQTSTLC